MGWLGAILLIGSGLWGAVLWCGESRRRLRLGWELRRQLPALERGILAERRPLGDLAEELRQSGGEPAFFWGLLQERLAGEESFVCCWRAAVQSLPPPYGELLHPLGAALGRGGREAETLLAQADRELARHLEQAGQTAAQRERLALTLGFSAAAMAALALI